ncbi:MAG: methionine biosynthesis protein MetW [Chloroflexota bacterium]
MTPAVGPPRPKRRRLDYRLIQGLVPASARVLDLGCGDGQLLAELEAHKGCTVRGIEINDQLVRECIAHGVPVYHGDMVEGITFFGDNSFDVVILSQTLQQTSDPLRVLHEMLRVGRTGIVSFPNFGYWRIRAQLLLRGRMPRTPRLSYEWYDTPNVHLCTVADFRAVCRQEGLLIGREMFLAPPARLIGPWLANWRAELAIFQICKPPGCGQPSA